MREKEFTLDLALDEAARCLLCYDAPCKKASPVETNVSEFIRSLRFKNIIGAAMTIRETNPLAAVCAETYPKNKLSEGACIRNKLDRNIEIMKLQKFLVKYSGESKFTDKKIIHPEKIAILNSGPTALATAGALLQKGYEVSMFEKESLIGGWMYNIVSNDSIQIDLNYLKKLGLEIKLNYSFDEEASIDEFRKDGYNAIVLDTLNYEYSKTNDLFTLPDIAKDKEKIIYAVRAGKLFAEEIIYNLNCNKLTTDKRK